MNEYTVFSEIEPSEEIKDAVCNGASPIIDCEFCGRTLFDETGENMEEGELDDLLKKHQESPKKYIPFPFQVHWGLVSGKQIVVNCPCNKLTELEELFSDNIYVIRKYLLAKTKDRLGFAQAEHNAAKEISEAVEA
jgi:hypothetical protein